MDPRLFSKEQWSPLSKSLSSSGQFLVPVEKNLVDAIWDDRPPPPSHIIHPLGIEYAGNLYSITLSFFIHSTGIHHSGKTWQDKVKDVIKELDDKNSSLLLLTALDDIACRIQLSVAVQRSN